MAVTAQDLADAVYEDIVAGVFPPGGRLVEERLTERYGVKRHALREALALLAEATLIERLPNRGAQVRDPDPREMRELYAIRLLLEAEAARITPLPAPSQALDEMEAIQARHSAALKAGDLRGMLRLNARFHRTQYACCGNVMLREAIADYARRAHPVTILKFPEARVMEVIEAQHRQILAAMAGTDTDALVAAVRAHFDHARLDAYEARWRAAHASAAAE
jgi:DNA-binding GntR family transcriptional regulator